MFVNDFFNLCDEKTKFFITKCLSIGYNLTACSDCYPDETRVEVKHGASFNSNDMAFFIFLSVLSFMSKKDLLGYNIDLEWFDDKVKRKQYIIPNSVKDKLTTYLDKEYRLVDRALEFAFDNTNITSYIKTYSDRTKSVVCLERIIYNFIKNEKWDKNIFSVPDEFTAILDTVATSKEQNLTTNKSINSNTSGVIKTAPKYNLPFGNVLTNMDFKYDPLIGREKELRMLEAFLMDEEKSVVIYGNPGTGKTALIKGLAYDIQRGNVPNSIKNKLIVEMSASELISGCRYVGMVEERLLTIINALIKIEGSVLFIDEIHTLMGLGQGNSNNDVSNILKPYLGDGRLKILGATTIDEYNLIKTNGAFSRRFNNIFLRDLTDDEILNILGVTSDRFKESHGISLSTDEDRKKALLKEILNVSKRAIAEQHLQRYNPDFSLSLLRLCYNFAALDGKSCLDSTYLIEGINNSDAISDEIKGQFQERIRTL